MKRKLFSQETGRSFATRRHHVRAMTIDEPRPATRQSRLHRGHRILAVQLGDEWAGTVHAPGSNAIVASLEGASAQEVMVRGAEAVNRLLASADG